MCEDFFRVKGGKKMQFHAGTFIIKSGNQFFFFFCFILTRAHTHVDQ